MCLKMKYVLLICFVVILSVVGVSSQDNDEGAIIISLSDYNPTNKTPQLFDVSTLLYPRSNIVINVVDVNYSKIEFFIIQVHSYYTNVVISNSPKYIKSQTANGTNIGLVQITTTLSNSYEFFIKNQNKIINATMLYIVVIPYYSGKEIAGKKNITSKMHRLLLAPIPGGCNMEFTTEIAPYQRLKYTDAVIIIDAQSASMKGHLCETQVVRHELFRMYLPETDYTSSTYFDGIRRMLTAMDISNYGTQISKPNTGFLRQLYNAYRGTGSVYAIVAHVNGSQSAYVPIVSYACDILNSAESCEGPYNVISKILCSLLVFLGLFTCFFGHKFFRTEMFLVGALVGGYITFLIFTSFKDFSDRDTILLSIGIGSLLGLTWVSFWHYCGIPILSTLLTLLVFGFLIGAVVFYAGLSDIIIVHNDITYWGFFSAIVLLCMTILMSFIHKANIIACGLVGAYAFILPLDHYYGTNLKYIFINTIRRATVPNFGSAIIDAPFQWKDLVLTILWLGLAFSGVAFQWRQQIGRPPFPPTSTRLQPPNERTPLLRPTSSMDPSDRIILIHSIPSDV